MSDEPGEVEALRAELAALKHELAASEARADALERIASIVDRAPDFIGMSDTSGRIVFINQAGRRAAGFGPEEDLGDYRNTDSIPKRYWPLVFDEGRATALRDGTWKGEAALLCRDGSEIPISISLSVHRGPDGAPRNVSSIMRDITAIKQLENELRLAEERLRHLLKSSPVVVYTARADGKYGLTFVSESITEILGYAPSDFIPGPEFWLKRLHPDDAPRVLRELPRVFAQGQNSYEYRCLDARGRYRWLLDQHKIIHDAAGEPREIVGSLLDITERKEAEETVLLLSTPLIPVSDRVLVMPLVGRMSEARGAQALATLLEGLGRTRARVAIVDITGVERVDEHVAQGLIESARAAQLLGAKVVITGIRPDVAQALVQTGVDLRGIVTLGSLQAGIAYAMRQG